MSFGAAVELAVAMPLSWLPLISDYTREAQKPEAATLASVVVPTVLVSCWMYVIGMGAAIFTGETDIAQIMLKAGLSIAALIIVVFSTVTTTFLDAFSAGMSCETIHGKDKRQNSRSSGDRHRHRCGHDLAHGQHHGLSLPHRLGVRAHDSRPDGGLLSSFGGTAAAKRWTFPTLSSGLRASYSTACSCRLPARPAAVPPPWATPPWTWSSPPSSAWRTGN
jgi:hypothetical protein